MKNVMLDLETLGTRPGSVILSIGAVFFDPLMNEPGPAFYQVINVSSCYDQELTSDLETVAWWEAQSDEAKRAYHEAIDGGRPIAEVLAAFAVWLKTESGLDDGAGSVRVWGNGAAFDNALLATAFRACGLDVPWKFSNDRCFRTLKALGKNLAGVQEPKLVGTKHNALDDAVHQAHWACSIFRALTPSLVPKGNRAPSLGDGLSVANHALAEFNKQYLRQSLPVTGEKKHEGEPAKVCQELMPGSPVGYDDALKLQLTKRWPVCAMHGTALIPTSTGFVCEQCGGGA